MSVFGEERDSPSEEKGMGVDKDRKL